MTQTDGQDRTEQDNTEKTKFMLFNPSKNVDIMRQIQLLGDSNTANMTKKAYTKG